MTGLETTWSASEAVINLSVMKENLEALKKKAGVDEAIVVVKANAYGHGAVTVARALEPMVRMLAVATVDEGVQLRRAGIEVPILVFGIPTEKSAAAYPLYRLTATVAALEHLQRLAPGTEYHVNIDTGMRRVGVRPEQVSDLRKGIASQEEIRCTGVYSHFATADEPKSAFVQKQHRTFLDVRNRLADLEVPFHMSNTAAVALYDLEPLDMIRVGIGVCGYTPGRTQWETLRPALEWRTNLVQVRPIARGEAVSYGHRWRAPDEGWLGTLPVGYADGVARSLTGSLEVRIGERMYPVAGSITMDYCMVFLGKDRPDEGESVILMGERAWRANEWAEKAGSITHETQCRLTDRVRRIYVV